MGALFGSLSAVYLMDAVGRKASLLAFSVMSLFIGWTLLMAASQHWQLYTGRFLLGKVTKFYIICHNLRVALIGNNHATFLQR